MASGEELRKIRTYKRTQVTKRINELRRLVVDDSYGDVIEKFDFIKGVFHEFIEAHNQYHDSLTEESDMLASDKYFEEVECKYIDGLKDVREYISQKRSSSSVSQAGASGTETNLVSYVKLPPVPQPDVFSGKPESYPMWKASFNTLVGKHNIGYAEKMFYLKQYTTGEAQSAIQALFLCPDKASYEAALNMLEERFGTPVLVASAFRKKLENWPKIGERDGKALQSFSDLLEQVCVAKRSYKSLEILSDEFENKKLLQKLPSGLVNKWIEIVVDSDGVFPNFDKFSQFIKDKAKVANHALWSGQTSGNQSSTKTKSQSSKSDSRVQAQTHVAQSESQSEQTKGSQKVCKGCPVCGDEHKVIKCSVFGNMTLAERRSCIREKNMCFGCLIRGHHSKDCRNRHVCTVCSKRHPTLLHDYSSQSNTDTTSETVTLANNTNCGIKTCNRVTTMILPVLLRHPESNLEVVVYALLDTQSNVNFVTDEVVKMLNVSGRHASLDLTTMSGRMNVPTRAVDGLELRGVSDGPYTKIKSCYVRDSIPCRREIIPTSDVVRKWPHLSHIDIPQCYENAPIGLLIGYHCPQVMRPLEIATGRDDEPFGWKTSLGWCIVGASCASEPVAETDELGSTHIVRGCIAFRTECHEAMVDVEHADATLPWIDEKYSAEDVKFIEIMSTKMFQRDDKHYEAPLPLKHETPFPWNKSTALRRLGRLKSKFQKDPGYHQRYSAVMQEMLDKAFAEPVPRDEVCKTDRTWYIPHHGVQQQDKLRVVFDCSSEFQGVSLNDRLLQGPNLINLLLGVLLRFRLEPVALTCDIQKMYYQFMVSPGDKDLLRYLWWKDGDFSSEPIDCRMRVHLFGATSSPGIAMYALRKIAKDHGVKHASEASQFIYKNFYVDDGVTSVRSVEAACNLIVETQKLLAEGGCRCHKVMSNRQEVVNSVTFEDGAPQQESNLHKTLGLSWNVETDSFHFPLDFDKSKRTRRGLLSTVAKIYDPLGVIAPLVHQGKLLLHQMCWENYSWDELLSGERLKAYEKWCRTLDGIQEVTIPRCVHSSERMFSPEMHHFADASSNGYAACSYLRFLDEDGIINISFIVGKCRVAPFKPVLTIPRLELVAAVLSVQLATRLRRELPFTYVEYFWTDSTIVLGYIKNESARFKVFVANRVQMIHEGSSPNQWFHVDSSENPADDGSRAVWSERWLRGPDFLKRPDLNTKQVNTAVSPHDVEVKCLSTSGDESQNEVRVHTSRNWYNTLKVWAWVLRFIDNCRGAKRKEHLKVEELERAKVSVLRRVQMLHFGKELSALFQQRGVPRSSPLFKLDVFLDKDKLIRVGGRIRHSSLSEEVKHPVVLPSNHEISGLIIQHFHQKTHHQGRGMTCSEVRSNGFWILKLQRLVKKFVRTCVTCSRLRGRPVEQKMADLPEDRLSPCSPFWFCGCDLFGPFVVKMGRRECKRYGVMFTCLVSRAVHLEVAHSLSTDSFLNAFRRFVALRGAVREIRCDQGTNLVGARNELLKMGCDIIFNPPSSSHRGGVWERLIGVARRIIEGILCEHGSRLDDEGLVTVMAEAASVINSRPLNINSFSDPQSLEPLTPNHLITMKSKIIPPAKHLFQVKQAELYATKQWRRVQYMIDLFWSRWKREIAQQYVSRPKWNSPRQNMKPGDIVLVIDDQCHRSFWKLARVTEADASRDGLVRSVKVQLADRSILHRPVQKLIRILSPECNGSDPHRGACV